MSRSHPLAAPLRRLLAASCAALVFALSVFAASPLAHDWLHAAEKRHASDNQTAPAAQHECAVVLFASGIDLPVAPLAATPPAAVVRGAVQPASAKIFLVSPRYLLRPERGPPSSRVS